MEKPNIRPMEDGDIADYRKKQYEDAIIPLVKGGGKTADEIINLALKQVGGPETDRKIIQGIIYELSDEGTK